jgi:formamidopyrimidine-DNA glycosylase
MPELPEVETVVRALRPHVTGLQIRQADFTLPRLLLDESPTHCSKKLKGQMVVEAGRRGKYAFLKLTRDTLVFHLGMTGRLTWLPHQAKPKNRFARTLTGYEVPIGPHSIDKHTHAVLEFQDGGKLLFRDPRTFGRIFRVAGHDLSQHLRFSHMGPEPLDCKPKEFLEVWPSTSSRPIKALLLDQTFVAGIGNIYADEALFHSGIHPATPVKGLQAESQLALYHAIRIVLKRGVKNQGTTFSDYRKPDGSAGGNYERLQVYGRGGQPCRKCKTVLTKTVLAQRGTVFCSHCQGENLSKKAHKKSSKN